MLYLIVFLDKLHTSCIILLCLAIVAILGTSMYYLIIVNEKIQKIPDKLLDVFNKKMEEYLETN